MVTPQLPILTQFFGRRGYMLDDAASASWRCDDHPIMPKHAQASGNEARTGRKQGHMRGYQC